MKTYAVLLIMDFDDEVDDPTSDWNWNELVGGGVTTATVWDVTDTPVERLRIDAEGPEELA